MQSNHKLIVHSIFAPSPTVRKISNPKLSQSIHTFLAASAVIK